jgi:hypothetical protein
MHFYKKQASLSFKTQKFKVLVFLFLCNIALYIANCTVAMCNIALYIANCTVAM